MLMTRLATALVLVPLVIAAVLLLDSQIVGGIVAVVMLLGAREWSRMMKVATPLSIAAFIVWMAGVMLALWWLWQQSFPVEYLLLIPLAWWLIATVWVTRYPAGFTDARPGTIVTAMIGTVVLGFAFLGLWGLHRIPGNGPELVLFVLFLVWFADTGAYFSGRTFGRHKLAVRVSPGKTWEGAIGGVLASGVFAGVIGSQIFGLEGAALIQFLLLCAIVVALSIVGDLSMSMFKRHAGIKDSGTLFPGHGGVLDRLDSIFAAAPVFLLGIKATGLMP